MTTNRPECPLIEARLPALVDADLPTGEAELVLAHLDGCRSCAAEAAAFRETLHRLQETSHDATVDFAHARDALKGALPPAPRTLTTLVQGRVLVTLVAAAAALALLVLHPPELGWSELRRAGESVTASLRPSEIRFDRISTFLTDDAFEPDGDQR